MAAPQYPSVLTEADWKKNKGVLAKVGSDPVGKQLNIVAAAHKGVLWQRFDVNKALAGGPATAAEIQAALTLAQDEYNRNVKLLLGRLKMLQDELKKQAGKSKSDHLQRMLTAAAQYSAQLQLVSAEFQAFEKLRADAQAAEKDRQAQLESDEPEDDAPDVDEPDDGRPRVPVKDVIGRKFFVELERVAFYKDPDVLQWTQSTELTLSPKTRSPLSELREIQTRGKKQLVAFTKAAAALKALGNQSLPPATAIRKLKQAWAPARKAFDQPGFLVGAYRQFNRRQVAALGGPPVVEAWRQQYPAAAALHQKVEQQLEVDQTLIEGLDLQVARLQPK